MSSNLKYYVHSAFDDEVMVNITLVDRTEEGVVSKYVPYLEVDFSDSE